MTVKELKEILNKTNEFDNSDIVLYNNIAEEDCICKTVEIKTSETYDKYTKDDSVVGRYTKSNFILVLSDY